MVDLSVMFYIIAVVFVIVSVALMVVVLLQKKEAGGLSAIGGSSQTYWDKNKKNSMEGSLERYTVVLGGVFMILSLVLGFIK